MHKEDDIINNTKRKSTIKIVLCVFISILIVFFTILGIAVYKKYTYDKAISFYDNYEKNRASDQQWIFAK